MKDLVGETEHWNKLLASLVDTFKFYFNEGNLDEAEIIFIKTEDLFQSKFCPNQIKALFYYYYGSFLVHDIFYKGYSPEKALFILEKGLSFIRKDQHTEIYSKLLDQKGSAIYYSEITKKDPDYTAAKDILEIALEIRKKINNLQLISETLFRIALIDERLGKTEEAIKKYREAYRIAKENNFPLEQSETSRHIGFTHYVRQEYDQALPYFLESHQLREEIGFKPGILFSRITLGDGYLALKRFSEAEKELTLAYADSKRFGIDRGVMISALSIGELYQTMNKKEKALTYYNEASQLAKKINHQIILKMAKKAIDEVTNSISIN